MALLLLLKVREDSRLPMLRRLAFAAIAVLLLSLTATAGDVHLTISKRTKPTPVQKLNREGVQALEKHQYAQAKALFYKAYLVDPDDPFTLNNLGYVAELEGEVDRAQRFYALASEKSSDAVIEQASRPSVIGKPVASVAGHAPDTRMKVNEMNVSAIGLLLKDRAPEADLLLQRALRLDQHNAFTLNNLGYAHEMEGEWEKALSYYNRAATTRSSDTVVVTPNPKWRGRPISEVAAQNAANLRKLMAGQEGTQARIARLNLRGVSAINRNDRQAARDDFESAYRLDPNDAFTLNNMGYLAEMDGDRETANFFYQRAQAARRSGARVEVATRREAEGRKLGEVAGGNDAQVAARMQAEAEAKRRQGGPIVLKRRDNRPVAEPAQAPQGTPAPLSQEPPKDPM